jgi:flagellin-like hook-associated protein FlgL
MSVDLDPHGNAAFDIQFDAADIPDVSGFDLSAGTTADNVRAEIQKVTSYRAKAQSFSEQASSYYDLVDVVINSNQAAGSVVRESDEVKELARLTDLQVRQQTLEAMSAQANVIRSVAAKLFDFE